MDSIVLYFFSFGSFGRSFARWFVRTLVVDSRALVRSFACLLCFFFLKIPICSSAALFYVVSNDPKRFQQIFVLGIFVLARARDVFILLLQCLRGCCCFCCFFFANFSQYISPSIGRYIRLPLDLLSRSHTSICRGNRLACASLLLSYSLTRSFSAVLL